MWRGRARSSSGSVQRGWVGGGQTTLVRLSLLLFIDPDSGLVQCFNVVLLEGLPFFFDRKTDMGLISGDPRPAPSWGPTSADSCFLRGDPAWGTLRSSFGDTTSTYQKEPCLHQSGPRGAACRWGPFGTGFVFRVAVIVFNEIMKSYKNDAKTCFYLRPPWSR